MGEQDMLMQVVTDVAAIKSMLKEREKAHEKQCEDRRLIMVNLSDGMNEMAREHEETTVSTNNRISMVLTRVEALEKCVANAARIGKFTITCAGGAGAFIVWASDHVINYLRLRGNL